MTLPEEFCPKNAKEWEFWLENNHNLVKGIWLIHNKKGTENYNLSYPEALDLALCYGWIDSTIKPINENQYKRYFSKRNVNSAWSKVNKEKIKKLIEKGLMKKSGLEAIKIAKENGSYYILDEAENAIIPEELSIELNKNLEAKNIFNSLSESIRRRYLRTIARVKTPEAKKRKIETIIKELLNSIS